MQKNDFFAACHTHREQQSWPVFVFRHAFLPLGNSAFSDAPLRTGQAWLQAIGFWFLALGFWFLGQCSIMLDACSSITYCNSKI
ncbi:hypothetical protein [Mailhella sp.]